MKYCLHAVCTYTPKVFNDRRKFEVFERIYVGVGVYSLNELVRMSHRAEFLNDIAYVALGAAATHPSLPTGALLVKNFVEEQSKDLDRILSLKLFDKYLRPDRIPPTTSCAVRGGLTQKDRLKNVPIGLDIVEKAEERLDHYSVIGQCLFALSQSSQYRNLGVGAAVSLIRAAIDIEQFRVYRNTDNVPTGLLTWGWLSARTIEKLSVNQKWDMHLSEWNEGETLCFRDIVVSKLSAEAIAADLGGGLFGDEPCCYLLVRDPEDGLQSLFEVPASNRHELGAWVLKNALDACRVHSS